MSRSIEELEFERNRQEILKQSRTSVKSSKGTSTASKMDNSSSKRYAWEYELEVYRDQKKRERFYKAGAWCGILSLVITLLVNYKELLALFGF